MQKTCPVRVFFGFDELEELIKLKKSNTPFLFLDHAYWKRGYELNNYRAIYNGVHLTRILEVEKPRKGVPRINGWRRGEQIIFIPGSRNILKYHKQQEWDHQALSTLAHSKRKVIVKSKDGGSMFDACKNAWCVVSHSSVAAVEAALLGIPVFAPDTSPASPIANPNLDDIENPLMPDRERWINSLSYAQFHLDEIKDGSAWKIIDEYQHIRGTEDGGGELVEAHRSD